MRTWHVGWMGATLREALGYSVGQLSHGGAPVNPAPEGLRTRAERNRSRWTSAGEGGDPQAKTSGYGRFTLHGRNMTLENMMSIVACAIRLVMVQKFQSPRQIALAYADCDKMSRFVISLDQRIARQAAGAHLATHPDDGTIDGDGTNVDGAAAFAKEFILLPSTPLSFVATGPEIRDSKRVSMLLEQQLEEIEEFKKPTEMIQRLAIRPLIRLQGESILACVEHMCYFGLCHERSINRDVLEYLFHEQNEVISEEKVKCHHLRAAFRNLYHKMRVGHGFEEYNRLSAMLKEVLQIETNVDEATSRRVYLNPCYTLAVCRFDSGAAIPARAGQAPMQRKLQSAFASWPVRFEDGHDTRDDLGLEYPYAFCPSALSSIISHRFQLYIMPKLDDSLMLDESFFIYSRARDVNFGPLFTEPRGLRAALLVGGRCGPYNFREPRANFHKQYHHCSWQLLSLMTSISTTKNLRGGTTNSASCCLTTH